MTLPNATVPHYFILKPHVGETLATDPLLNTAYGIAVEFSSEASVNRLLILSTNLPVGIRRSAHLLAVMVLSGCVSDHGNKVLDKVRWDGLGELVEPLRYFLSTPMEPGKFASVTARWERDVERWANASDELKIIHVAKLTDTIRRKEWFNFLQRQQLLERASMFVEAFTMARPENQTWVDELGKLVADLARAGESRNSALQRVLR